MFDPVRTGFAPREHRQFHVRTDFSKHRMNEENVVRMRQPKRGVQTRNDHEYAMKKTFMSGALAGPGLSRSRPRCDGRVTVHTAAAPTHSMPPTKSIPTPEENS
jgi:CDGSH-type Zn-finger protein